MDIILWLESLFLGMLEGLTEFIPVSSTAHLLLAADILDFQSPGRSFEVLIQLGSILAIVTVYCGKLWHIAAAVPHSPAARHFVLGVVLAFLPAAIVGAGLHGLIKTVFFESPRLICSSLILGGIVLLLVDKLPLKPHYDSAYRYPLWLCLVIGCFQCLAVIPGVSRSGSTIIGALLCGTDKRSAAEFSFFLAMPTMLGAFTFDLYKNHAALSVNDGVSIALGFIAAFLAGIFVVRRLLHYVAGHGYAVFAWWRIIVGLSGFAALNSGFIA
ncbi:MAG: undecaprenyl-diphosphate phosphatase [Candidatus Tokpelaia sp.]|nr:MAG: undecaprenyl-diphosphate phosphatase [Candidatus Tokpelaia sp.]KAA6207465.1 MAG: undecaprenyl-diphosphate phosphatase [Candidatus Tokpelaia sp.]